MQPQSNDDPVAASGQDRMIDCDSHIMEPADLWYDRVEPGFRSDCIRVVRDERDGDKLLINGKPSRRIRRLGGVRPSSDGETVNWDSLEGLPHYVSYRDSCYPESYDPRARLEWMDRRGIQASILFPSLGLLWPNEITGSAEYVRAHMAAYDRWLMEFSQTDAERLVPVAQVALFDQSDAIRDLESLRKQGFRHTMLPVVPGESESPFHERYTELWHAIQSLGFAVHLHKVAIPYELNVPVGGPLGRKGTGAFFAHVNQTLSGQMCLASLMDARIPDRFPGVRFVFLECNAGWLPAWLDRADETFEVLRGASGNGAALRSAPRHYLDHGDSFFFSLGPTEDVSRLEGFERRLLLATDFPHPGFSPDPAGSWADRLRALPALNRLAILRENARRLIGS